MTILLAVTNNTIAKYITLVAQHSFLNQMNLPKHKERSAVYIAILQAEGLR